MAAIAVFKVITKIEEKICRWKNRMDGRRRWRNRERTFCWEFYCSSSRSNSNQFLPALHVHQWAHWAALSANSLRRQSIEKFLPFVSLVFAESKQNERAREANSISTVRLCLRLFACDDVNVEESRRRRTSSSTPIHTCWTETMFSFVDAVWKCMSR